MFQYIKNLISADTKERVAAFLAVIAGISLCFGFSILIFQKNKSVELGIVTAGLVTLATFSKVDNIDRTDNRIDKIEDKITEDK